MNEHNETVSPPVEVPASALSKEALANLIEAFILREGTDYGATEISFETKVEQVKKQLDKEDVVIVYDPSSESVTLLTQKQWQRAKLDHESNQ